MSRRKQEKPQPRKNLVKGEVPDLQVPDILTCGVCRKDFPLADIVRFIQHKVQLCNKENSLGGDPLLYEDSEEDSNHPPAALVIPKKEEEECPQKQEEPVSSSSIIKMVNAKDATVNTQDFSHEPRSYICSTCKQSLSSAWALIQHAQNIHGLSICADSPPVDEHLDIHFGGDSSSALFNLRAPLLERQIEPIPLFVRNSSQELRLDLNGKSSNSLSNGRTTPPPLLEPPKISNCEDFYSQRLRVLAGATSPNSASTPRKLLQPNFKTMLNNAKTSPNSCTPPLLESSSLSPSQSNNHNNSSASSTTSDHPQTPSSAKSRLCEYCGKSFQFKSNLIVHRRSHTGEKPFKCHICNHACTQASKLKRHMKTHRGKKEQLSNGQSKSGEVVENGDCKPHEKQANGDGEYGSDEREDEEMDDEEGDAEDEEEEEVNVDGVEDDDCLQESEGNLVIDQSTNDDDMVAEDLTKKPLKNGTYPVENGTPTKKDKFENKNKLIKHSVISEIMENIGFGCIPPYNEAYKQALKESSFRNSLKQDRYSSGTEGSASNDAVSHHSYDVMSFHPSERPPREGTRSAGQSPLSFGGGLLDTFDQSLNMKRIRLEDPHKDKDREGNFLYAGVWFPRVEAPQQQFRDLYGVEAVNNHNSKSETALCVRPGPSQMSLVVKPKDSPQGPRRNDTCEYCGKVFKNCSNLTVHRRSHTGEKPYKCELCSYACAQSSKLTRHMKTHGRLGKDVYRCRFCDMPFSVASTLEKHMRKCVVSQSGNGSPYLVSEPEENSKEMTAA